MGLSCSFSEDHNAGCESMRTMMSSFVRPAMSAPDTSEVMLPETVLSKKDCSSVVPTAGGVDVVDGILSFLSPRLITASSVHLKKLFSAADDTWTCTMCTFLNASADSICGACETLKIVTTKSRTLHRGVDRSVDRGVDAASSPKRRKDSILLQLRNTTSTLTPSPDLATELGINIRPRINCPICSKALPPEDADRHVNTHFDVPAALPLHQGASATSQINNQAPPNIPSETSIKVHSIKPTSNSLTRFLKPLSTRKSI